MPEAESPDIIGRLDSILAAEQPAQPAQQPAPAAQPEPDAAPAQDAPQEEAPAAPNKQVEGAEAEASQPDDRPVAEIPLDQLEAIELEVTVKGFDGKDVVEKLPIKALRDGYMKDADYRRKTTELARQRDQLHEETRKGVEAERVQYLKELQTLNDFVLQTAAAELKDVDWANLARTDAFEYVRLDARKKEVAHALESIRAKQKEVIEKHESERKAATREAAAKAVQTLESDIPGWNDTLYQGLMKAGVEQFGFKPEEVSNWVDPRIFKLLHAAQAGTKAKAETKADPPPVAKRVVVPPRVLRPGATTAASQGQQRHAEAMKRLHEDGKIDSAAAVIKARIGNIS